MEMAEGASAAINILGHLFKFCLYFTGYNIRNMKNRKSSK